MADALEAVRQDMLEETADELVSGKFVCLEPVVVSAISVPVGDATVVACDESVVADGCAVCIPSQVLQQFPRAGEGGFRIDDPRFVSAASEPAVAGILFLQLGQLGRDVQGVVFQELC